MNILSTQKYPKGIVFYYLARFFERAGFYGIRGMLVAYMMYLYPDREEVLTIYGWFAASIYVSNLIGALLGDLLIGNRISMIMGNGLQLCAAILICLPSPIALYLGLGFLSLGGGLVSTNLTAQFGKQFSNKPALLDGGFTLWYFAITLGAAIGGGIITVVALVSKGHKLGFIAGAVFFLLSLLFSLLAKRPEQFAMNAQPMAKRQNKNVFYVLAAILFLVVFWVFYDMGGAALSVLQMSLAKPEINGPDVFWFIWNPIFLTLCSVIFSILWSFVYVNPARKISIGFIVAALAFFLLTFIPREIGEGNAFLFFVSMFLLCLAEALTPAILTSQLIRFANPKYLASLLSISFMPTALIHYLLGDVIGLLNDGHPFIGSAIAAGVFLMFGLALFILSKMLLPNETIQEENQLQ